MKLPIFALLLLSACSTVPDQDPQQAFFERLSSLCGSSLQGRMIGNDPQDRDLAGQPMSATFHSCTAQEVRARFQVGEDASRNWVISRTVTGLRLKHIHLHKDGSEDELSRYGGDTVSPGSDRRQAFPADEFSKQMFDRRAIPQSKANVWAVEVEPRAFFAYELRRPGRFFRVEFTPGASASGVD